MLAAWPLRNTTPAEVPFANRSAFEVQQPVILLFHWGHMDHSRAHSDVKNGECGQYETKNPALRRGFLFFWWL